MSIFDLSKNENATKIQKWYRKHLEDFEDFQFNWDENKNYKYEKAYLIRLKILDYNNKLWKNFPAFAETKAMVFNCNIIPYCGNGKKTDIIKWIVECMSVNTLIVIGH